MNSLPVSLSLNSSCGAHGARVEYLDTHPPNQLINWLRVRMHTANISCCNKIYIRRIKEWMRVNESVFHYCCWRCCYWCSTAATVARFFARLSWNIQIIKACWMSFNAQSFHRVLSPECVRFLCTHTFPLLDSLWFVGFAESKFSVHSP